MSTDVPPQAANVVAFWREAGPARWFARDAAFDARCSEFLPLHLRAARRELDGWMATAEGALALLILLDQIPRNVYRGSAHAWATDPLARHFAARALDAGLDMAVDAALRVFVYMPFEHSESLDDQHRAMQLFARMEDPESLRWARVHCDIIERFGRFPHRNDALGRTTTAEERAFLDGGGFAG
jgi:uncharacterized protein (DUF924 family)